MSMGRRYCNWGQRACAATAPQTILGLTSAGSNVKGPKIYDVTLGSNATPADNALLFEAQRYTAAGTGATTTASTPLDTNSDTASDITAVQNNSGDPTYTANLILGYWPLNQRATHRWIADPLGPMVGLNTASNGIGFWATHASFTGNVSCMVHYYE